MNVHVMHLNVETIHRIVFGLRNEYITYISKCIIFKMYTVLTLRVSVHYKNSYPNIYYIIYSINVRVRVLVVHAHP